MRLPHAVVAADKRGERHRFRRGKGRIPPGAMLCADNFLAEFTLIGSRNLVADKLLSRVRVLAFAQAREMFRSHCAAKAPFLRKPALPFAMTLLVAAPIVLLLRRELTRVIGARLTG